MGKVLPIAVALAIGVFVAAPAGAMALDDLAPVARWTCAAPGLDCNPCVEHCTNPTGSVGAGVPVAFDGRNASDDRNQTPPNLAFPRGEPNGTIVSWTWDFKDGQTAGGKQVTHAFTKPGVYAVALKATDNSGKFDEKTLNIKVTPAPPIARFGLGNAAVAGVSTLFDARASTDADGSVASYAWSFGDGTTGSGPLLGHVFARPGTYGVRLTVTDNEGRQGTQVVNVSVLPSPIVSALGLSSKSPRAKRARRVRLSFQLASAATVTARIEKAASGRRVGKKCARPSRRNRKKRRCTRYVGVASRSLAGTAGANSVTLGTIAGRKRLRAGRYRVVLRTGANSRTIALRIKR